MNELSGYNTAVGVAFYIAIGETVDPIVVLIGIMLEEMIAISATVYEFISYSDGDKNTAII